MRRKGVKRLGFYGIVLLVLSGFLLNSAPVFAVTGMNHVPNTVSEKDQLKILSLLKQKTGDQQLLEKAREKLLSLDEKQTRLITSLSERIKDGQTAGDDVAYLLIAVLIILS